MHNLSKRIYRVCWHDDAYSILDEHELDMPDQGGCLVIAEALRRAAGHGTLAAFCDIDGRAQHYTLQVGSFHMDAQGCSNQYEVKGRLLQDHWCSANRVVAIPDLDEWLVLHEEEEIYKPEAIDQLVTLFETHSLGINICDTFGFLYPGEVKDRARFQEETV